VWQVWTGFAPRNSRQEIRAAQLLKTNHSLTNRKSMLVERKMTPHKKQEGFHLKTRRVQYKQKFKWLRNKITKGRY